MRVGFQADPRDLELDALLNRIRAQHGIRPRDAEDRRQFNAGWIAGHVDAADHLESRIAEDVSRAFRASSPALVRWRDRVLRHPRRYPKADVAAAYELLALEADLGGETKIAARARSQARRAMGIAETAAADSSTASPQQRATA